VVECLLCKHEDLTSNLGLTKKGKDGRKEGRKGGRKEKFFLVCVVLHSYNLGG
jgi:hypothetical protein